MYWYYLLHDEAKTIHVGIRVESEGRFAWNTSLLRPGTWGKRWPSDEFAGKSKPFELHGEARFPTLEEVLDYVEERIRKVVATENHADP